MYKEIKILNSCNEEKFTKDVNQFLEMGWEILSTSCGFVDSEQYDYCGSYQVILGLKQ